MRKLFYVLLVLSVALVLAACGTEKAADISSDTSAGLSSARVTAQSTTPQLKKGTYIEGELLVKFKPGVKTSASLRSHETVGARVMKRSSFVPNLEQVTLPQGLSVKDAVALYMSDPNVEIAEPNCARRVSETIPNDQLFGEQWALRNPGMFAAGTVPADIKAYLAWDITQGNHNTVVAVLDTGIDYSHADLVENIWRNWDETSCTDGIDNDNNGFIDDCVGWDFTTCEEFELITPDPEEYPDFDYCDESIYPPCKTEKDRGNNTMDVDGHGTFVAGITGAHTNNGIGIAGVMWHVQLMPVKVLNDQGIGRTIDVIDAINYVVDMKQRGADIKAINASLGGRCYSELERQAIEAANTEGILFVAAAGNGGSDGVGDNNDFFNEFETPEYPASYSLPNIISVAATDQNDRKASFSNFGQQSVHLGAPGVYILSLLPGNRFNFNNEFASGTSGAAPHVTGAAGLIWNYYYYFNYSQVRGMILRYVDILPELQRFVYTGGRLDAYGALSALLKPTDLALNVDSFTQITLSWTDHATGEDYYLVERSTSGGPFEHITTLGPNTTTYTDSSLTDGTRYTYRVRAMSSLPNPPTFEANEAYSFYSNEASAVTPLIPPTGLSATAVSSSQINLSWTDHSQAEDGYRIERSSSNFVQIAQVGPNVTFYSDTGLNPQTTYTYRVMAFNAVPKDSEYSNEASATTLTSGGAPPPSSGGSGGSCSIGARQNTPTAFADLAVMLIPFLYIVLLRRRR
jgi:subtilisin family serine protease